jgi:3-hydroxyacyl-CoA dehydrogenase
MSTPINHVAVVGCGLIGAGWASWFISRGLSVTCSDPAPGIWPRLRHRVSINLAELGHGGAVREHMLARLDFEPELEVAVAPAEWIQECAPEDLELKRQTLAAIDRACGSQVVIASSTSSLKIGDLQRGLSHPERLVAGHPFLPVTLIPLVEVAGGGRTSDESMDRAMEFYESVGKRPIRLRRELTGHVANRLQAALMREAFFLLQTGVASARDIDRALTEGPGLRWVATGPFVSHHLAGGEGGARQAFENLGGAMRAMWADLGNPTLTPELQLQVIAGTAECLAEKTPSQWAEERWRLVRAVQRERALIESEGRAR